MYDAVVGRMLSADKYVADASNSQDYNRYSYVRNNPLKYTDPSGWRLHYSGPSDNANDGGVNGDGNGGGSRFIGNTPLVGTAPMLTSWGTTMLGGTFYAPSQQYYMNPLNGNYMFGNQTISGKQYYDGKEQNAGRGKTTVTINYDYVYDYSKSDPKTKLNERIENVSIDWGTAEANNKEGEGFVSKFFSNLRIPDFYTLNISVGSYIGWNGSFTVDRYGKLYVSPIGVSGGKSTTFVSGSFTFNWINQFKKPTNTETYNFLSGHSVNIGAGFIGGACLSISPTNNGTKTATGFGFFSPQIGISYNYTPSYFIFKLKK